ncbi:uncharacterized protein LOC111400713 [Olea europaea var. sylvestris]|uniref:uncharacterized protein LOC111400713 n=1 Tax=Olea europaea var. sylvestris TaxID=158386 RepID=UPI000C1D422A|nr:uncharacterized protein LOC111400713 [Olea europaea var. sylvestris]
MMHGHCENLNPKNVCMEKNFVCKKKYPRDYVENTSLGNDSYPLYKRSNDGVSVKVRGCMLDNRWVVLYNPYILAKYDCHINVDVYSSVKAVKYLYKYVYKRHDHIHFTLNKETNEQFVDEISNYQTTRWISPPEAMWRIFRFDLFDISPTVISLQLHTKDAQTVTYKETNDLSKVINKDFVHRTIKSKNIIGRIVRANSCEGEMYFLRVLLNHIRGSKSFEDLKIVNSIVLSTYYEAALSHSLLSRNSYSNTEPRNLWDKFKNFIIEDYLHKGFTQQSVKMKALHCINSFLEGVSKNIIDFCLVDFDLTVNDDDIFETMIAEEITNINFQSNIHYSESLIKSNKMPMILFWIVF